MMLRKGATMRFLHEGLRLFAALCALSATSLLPARADTVDFSGGFAGATGLQFNGNAKIAGSRLQITDGNFSPPGSAFTANPVNVTRFHLTFDFQQTYGVLGPAMPIADGMTFTIQNAGPYALGGGGGGLGYGTDYPGNNAGQFIPRSVAVKYDLYNNYGEGFNSTGLYKNGESPSNNATTVNLDGTGIDLHSGHVFHVVMDYDGATLASQITDTTTSATASQSYTIDIPGTVGSASAHIGFTGASGGFTVRQSIFNWILVSPQARTIRVSTSGNDGNDGSTWGQAKRNIQAALNSARPGDQVWVARGTYFEHIGISPGVELYGGFAGTESTLLQRSIGTTTINGSGTGFIVYLAAGGAPPKINGFTLANGDAGVLIGDNASPVISQNAIVNNHGDVHGYWADGISGYNSNATITNNYIANNSGIGDGGGILLGDAHPVIYGNTVTGNVAGRYGGGIETWHNSSAIIANNNVTQNTGKVSVGGIIVFNGSPDIRFNYVANNNGFMGAGGDCGGIAVYGVTDALIGANYVAGNKAHNTGGVVVNGGTNISVFNNTIINNVSDFPTGIGGIAVSVAANVPIFNNLIDGNSGLIGGVQRLQLAGQFQRQHPAEQSRQFCRRDAPHRRQRANIAIVRNRFLNNLSDDVSGAIETAAPNPLIANNLMAGNQAVYGAAIGVAQGTSPRIFNNTIVGNKATGSIGGINAYKSSPIIANNIIAFNINGGVARSDDTAHPIVHHNDVFGNTLFDIASDVAPGAGNVFVDPLFVDRTHGDYHLMGTSPVIDAGDDSLVGMDDVDLDGLARILNAHVDMGAFEYPLAHDVTAFVTVQAGGFRYNRANGHFAQTVTLINTGQNALSGPISLVLDTLSANAALVNKKGVTSATVPAGSPYADFPTLSLAPGAKTQITLDFTDPTRTAITYKVRVLAGPASR